MTDKTKRFMYRDEKGKWHWIELPYKNEKQFKSDSHKFLIENNHPLPEGK